VVCYYTNWAQYRNGLGRFYPENIDPNLCTHINYAFAQLRDGVIVPYEWNDESTAWSTGMFARIMNLRKTTRPKILLALGGWNFGSGKFSDMARNETKRATFIATTIIFLQQHKFDGLDIDWVTNKNNKMKNI
jgi:chitinase